VTPRAGPLRILVVDDEPAILRFLHASLESQGYIVATALDARTALDMVRRNTADLIILDLGLPDMDGLDVIRQIRDGGETLPIIILSNRENESAKVTALDLGADDYVTKPFGIDELLARIRTAQRHRLQQEGERPLFQAGDLSVDLVRRLVTVRGSEVKLTPREYEVLRLMMANAGKVLTHHFIVQKIWGRGANVQYLRIYIRALRQKIEADPERPTLILTEIRVGYRLCQAD
jgi:two-component system KDP operon response regulator KdpE